MIVRINATLYLTAVSNNFSETPTIQTGGTLWCNQPEGGAWTNDVVDNGTFGGTIDPSAPFIFTGQISGSGGFSWSDVGYQFVTLAGTNNTYTGPTTVKGSVAVQSLAPLGQPSSIGAPTTVLNGTIYLVYWLGTTFKYLGTTATTDRVISFNGNATLDASGTGPLVLTSDLTTPYAGSQTLTLQGANTGTNTILGAIPNYSGAYTTSVTKPASGSGSCPAIAPIAARPPSRRARWRSRSPLPCRATM